MPAKVRIPLFLPLLGSYYHFSVCFEGQKDREPQVPSYDPGQCQQAAEALPVTVGPGVILASTSELSRCCW